MTTPPLDYAACRARFRHAATVAGATLHSAPIDGAGPDGADLTIDVALLGPAQPERLLVLLSGVHGVEGFVGSAIQCDLLEAPPALPPRTGVLLVHAVNPWGMAWLRRQNEHNVDLNRNWARSRTPFPANPDYADLHPDLCPADLGDTREFLTRMQAHVDRLGLARVAAAISGGQDTHPDGMHYAGVTTEDSNLLLAVTLPGLADPGGALREVLVVDLHTGEGGPGEVVLLAGGPAGSPNHEWLVARFGTDAVRATDGSTPGRIAPGVASCWPGAAHHFVTVEFGTVSDARQLAAARDELWWHTQGDASDPRAVAARAAYRRAFTPDDPAWMEQARHHGALLVRAGLAAIGPPTDGLGWLGARGRDGGIDRIPLPDGVPGGLSACGKHAIGPDHDAALARAGATTVVCLVEAYELEDRYPEYLAWLRSAAAAGTAVWFPIHDLHAPPLDRALELLAELRRRMDAGEHLLLHCAAGIGRTGTVAACLLIGMGMDAPAALAHVAAHRPMAGPEVGAQQDLVAAVAAQVQTMTTTSQPTARRPSAPR